jgi:hypothetical protein
MAKNILRPLIIALCILIIPLIGTQTVDGWNWDFFDFVFAFVLIFGVGLAYEFVSKKAQGSKYYKVAAGLSLLSTFCLVWINAAVGIIGEDNGTNLLYFLALLIGFVSALVSRLEPQGMSRAMFATAIAIFIVPIIVLFAAPTLLMHPPGTAGIFTLNTIFVILFTISGFIFRKVRTRSVAAN